ncbi:hypothetical protein [Dactylosporangium sp. NPDC006015]|uniref:hypothetical protein n=1 Tax=Dactylosporangium sp. NPDC006015 TaxID=3154576 RepID=UPI0033A91B24
MPIWTTRRPRRRGHGGRRTSSGRPCSIPTAGQAGRQHTTQTNYRPAATQNSRWHTITKTNHRTTSTRAGRRHTMARTCRDRRPTGTQTTGDNAPITTPSDVSSWLITQPTDWDASVTTQPGLSGRLTTPTTNHHQFAGTSTSHH